MPLHRSIKSLLLVLVAVATAALCVAGCGAEDHQTLDDDVVNSRNQIDSAYETIIAEQNEIAVNYSNAILKETDDADVKVLAQEVLDERAIEADILERLVASGQQKQTTTQAAKTLGIPLDKLGLTADGKTLAAPSSDTGYLKAMEENVEGALRATEVELDGGGPGTVSQLGNRVRANRVPELAMIKKLLKQQD
jgi:uncharacterized protein (DUF305 family)